MSGFSIFRAGEEEKEYWRKMFRDIAERKQRTKNRSFQTRKRRGGGRGGGGRGGGGRGGGRPFHKRVRYLLLFLFGRPD